jgi:DNA-binding transcriptional ArsR family regulator
MEPAERSSTHRVQGRAQAAALEHLLRAWLLLACTRRERSLGELARELGLPFPKAHYHMTKLLDCGLLQVVRTQARQGRPIRYYRAIAEAFLVSSADLSEQVSDRLARELRQSVAQEVNRRESFLRYHLDPSGRPRVRQLDPEGRGVTERAMDHWKIMRLTSEQRVALAGELAALITRYEDAQAVDGGELYLVHAAFAPKLLV